MPVTKLQNGSSNTWVRKTRTTMTSITAMWPTRPGTKSQITNEPQPPTKQQFNNSPVSICFTCVFRLLRYVGHVNFLHATATRPGHKKIPFLVLSRVHLFQRTDCGKLRNETWKSNLELEYIF